MNGKEACFPEKNQTEDVVEGGVGQQGGLNGSVAWRLRGGVQTGEGLDLCPEVGRSIDEKPAFAIRADGCARLRARLNRSLSREEAISARAIPLRESTAGCRS